MSDGTSKPDDERTVYHQPNWNVETVNQTVVVQSGSAPAELTPEELADAETRYRAQVIKGTLDIQPASGGGCVVLCRFRCR